MTDKITIDTDDKGTVHMAVEDGVAIVTIVMSKGDARMLAGILSSAANNTDSSSTVLEPGQ